MAAASRNTRAVVAGLVVGVFFGGMVGGVAFPTLPRLGVLLGFSALVVGVVLAVNRATRMVVNAPAGALLDRVGTRRPMLAGFALEALAPAGYLLGLTDAWTGGLAAALPVDASGASAATFVVARILWGVGSAFVLVGAFSVVTKVTTPENRGRWAGYMRGGQSLGFPAGLVVGGLTADVFGFRAAFATAGLAAVVAFAVGAVVLPDIRPDDAGDDATLRDVPALAFSDRRVLAVGATNFVVRLLYSGVLLSTVVEYAAENDIRVGVLSATGVSGVVMAVCALFAAGATVVAGPVSDRAPTRSHVAVPALCLLAAGFLALVLSPTLAGAIVGVALVGVGVEGANLPLLAYLGDVSPAEDVGKLGGVYNVFGDFGATLGPLVALPVATATSYASEYVGCALLAVAIAVVVAAVVGDTTPVGERAVPADD
ncbi:MAG: MFS transporter [Halarchaeum sp.]